MEKKTGAMEHPRYTDFRVLTISVITRLQCTVYFCILCALQAQHSCKFHTGYFTVLAKFHLNFCVDSENGKVNLCIKHCGLRLLVILVPQPVRQVSLV